MNNIETIHLSNPTSFRTAVCRATKTLGGKVRCIDQILDDATFALVSECPGYPVNWKPTKMVVAKIERYQNH